MVATFLVVAGPNGAGKSTFTKLRSFGFPILDPDAIARTIDNRVSLRLLMAGRTLHEKIEEHFSNGTSFGLETTLSGQSIFATMRRAKTLGMKLAMHYVGVEQLEFSKLRVLQRAQLGGHGVPEKDLERRFMRSAANLHRAARIVDEGYVYNSSSGDGLRLLAEKIDGRWVVTDRSMPWLTDGLAG